MNVYITESDLSHAQFLADHIREEDRLELDYAFGEEPYEAIANGINNSDECYTVMVDDNPALIFGIRSNSIVSYNGVIWMLSTDLIHDVGFRFVRNSKRVVKILMQNKKRACNYVWSGNTISITWLKWLGFNIHPPAPYGKQGKLFHYFEMVNDNV